MNLNNKQIDVLKYLVKRDGLCLIDSDCDNCIFNYDAKNDKYEDIVKVKCSSYGSSIAKEAKRILHYLKFNII